MSTNQKLAPGSEWLIDDQILDREKRTHFIANNEIVVCDQMASISVADAIALIDRANLDPVRVAARRLTHELRRNLDVVRFAVPGAHYDNIIENLKELEALL